MKIRLLFVGWMGALASVGIAPGEKLVPTNVQRFYFAIRSDGKPGSGTLGDPFDGRRYRDPKAAEADGFVSRYDRKMRELTRNQNGRRYEIQLGPGVYETYGDYSDHFEAGGVATKGYLLQSNTTLRGAGKGLTVIRLAGWGPAGNIHRPLSSGSYEGDIYTASLARRDNITVESLTVDGNAQALGIKPNDFSFQGVCIYGVFLLGSNHVIRDVEVRGIFGMTDDNPNDVNGVGFESFGLSISTFGGDSKNALIENCIVRDTVGYYISAIGIGGGESGTVSGIVTNNAVIGVPYVAYGIGGTKNAVYSNNIAQDTAFGLRGDTGPMEDIVIINNVFQARAGAIKLTNASPKATLDGVRVVGNALSASRPTAGEPAAGVISVELTLGQVVRNFIVQGNVITSPDKAYPALHLNPAVRYEGGVFKANVSHLPTNLADLPAKSFETDAVGRAP